MNVMYGINNCDTIKKAKAWLVEANIEFDFHDYKKLGVDKPFIQRAIQELGAENVINKRGTTYRKLSDDEKASITGSDASAIDILMAQPSMIKRPILDVNGVLHLGFKPEQYGQIFK